jgi:hypothetical protein
MSPASGAAGVAEKAAARVTLGSTVVTRVERAALVRVSGLSRKHESVKVWVVELEAAGAGETTWR